MSISATSESTSLVRFLHTVKMQLRFRPSNLRSLNRKDSNNNLGSSHTYTTIVKIAVQNSYIEVPKLPEMLHMSWLKLSTILNISKWHTRSNKTNNRPIRNTTLASS